MAAIAYGSSIYDCVTQVTAKLWFHCSTQYCAVLRHVLLHVIMSILCLM